MAQFVFYSQPAGPRRRLTAPPALASWDKAGSPGQLRSAAFIAGVHAAAAEALATAPDPLGMLLEVGLPRETPLLGLNDLDNYLFPLVPRLLAASGREFASVWATKIHDAESHVTIGTVAAVDRPAGSYSFAVTTSASASTTAFKEQVRDQVGPVEPLPGGPVALQISFVVGPRRVWPNLWKATIDSLGAILGRDDGAREWNARDGRITMLGLHCAVDSAAGNQIRIAINASSA